MLSVSFQTQEETMTFPATFFPKHLQFSNYADAWNSRPFPMFLKNSVIVVVSILVIQLFVMIPAAYAFAKYEFKGKNILFGLVIIAFMTPGQVTFLPVYQMMADWKLLGTLIPQILPFMTSAFGIFLLRQYFKQIPDELIEAAKLDNATERQILMDIILPMSKAALSTFILFNFISHWNDYFWPLVMTNSDKVRPLTVAVKSLHDTEGLTNWNIVMAGNMLLVGPILVVYLVASRNIIKAFTYSGIK
jgi:sn-glycerol 3-phosphate transport system permease protein